MKFLLIIIFIFQINGAVSQIETAPTNPKVSSLKIYYPTFFYFDPQKLRFGNPLGNFGLSYKWSKFDISRVWRCSFEHQLYSSKKFEFLGEVESREVFFLSIGVGKRFANVGRFNFNWFGELSNRLGNETIYGGGGGISVVHIQRQMLDFGGTIGFELDFRISKRLSAALLIKQSFYYYRFDRGVDGWELNNGTPRNVIIASFGLGWDFVKKNE